MILYRKEDWEINVIWCIFSLLLSFPSFHSICPFFPSPIPFPPFPLSFSPFLYFLSSSRLFPLFYPSLFLLYPFSSTFLLTLSLPSLSHLYIPLPLPFPSPSHPSLSLPPTRQPFIFPSTCSI